LEDSAKPVAYRPLSLIAVAGCGLAGLYTAFVLIGGLVNFLRGTPWLQHPSLVLIPIVAAVLSIVGLVTIQRSEGTLAGEKAARWGLALSILVGLGYWAYYGATYVAIGREADGFARDFLQKLTRRQALDAFRLTLNPATRPVEGRDLRTQLEQRFNSLSEMGSPGVLTMFVQDDKVRMLEIAGSDKTTIESVGISRLEYASGSYEVDLQYRITSPEFEMVLYVPVVGKAGKQSEGRQWSVIWTQVGMPQGDFHLTDEGQKTFYAAMQARRYFEEDCFPLIRQGKKEELYLQTLLPDERARFQPASAVRPIGMLAASTSCACPALTRVACLPGFEMLLERTAVRADKVDFWAPNEEARDEIIRTFHDEFRRPRDLFANAIQFPKTSRIPRIQQQDGRYTIENDVTIMVPLGGVPLHYVEARLVADFDAAELGNATIKSWRLRGLDLVSGRSFPKGPMRPDMMPPNTRPAPGP
jgi:hypothetical protein